MALQNIPIGAKLRCESVQRVASSSSSRSRSALEPHRLSSKVGVGCNVFNHSSRALRTRGSKASLRLSVFSAEAKADAKVAAKAELKVSIKEPKAKDNERAPTKSDEPTVTLPLPTFEDVSMAWFRVRAKDGVKKTECAYSSTLSKRFGFEVYLKCEYKQSTGSFKERGARNALMTLSAEEAKFGVCAASAGNHALAMAYHGKALGIPVTVVMPLTAPITKVSKCRQLGAEVILHGNNIAEAAVHAQTFVKERNLTYINGFDNPGIIAGAGTVGIEILEQMPDVDAIVVPVGGGGLIAGIALAIKKIKPDTELIGVEPQRCASFQAALDAGRPVRVDLPRTTLADGLAVPCVGPHAFAVAQGHVDRVVAVNELEVSLAVLRLVEDMKIVQEGAGAAGLAAALGGHLADLRGKKVCVLLCGGNIDTPVLGRVIERGLAADGRLVRFSLVVSDRPGGISALCQVVYKAGASIRDITHERAWLQEGVDQVEVYMVVETIGPDHAKSLKGMLEESMREQPQLFLSWGKTHLEIPEI